MRMNTVGATRRCDCPARMWRTLFPPPLLAARVRLMMRPMRSRPTTLRGLRSPHSPTRREWTAAARPVPPRPCTSLLRQGRRV
eukprot:223590-Pleurochrysis_carterae.AAC.1